MAAAGKAQQAMARMQSLDTQAAAMQMQQAEQSAEEIDIAFVAFMLAEA